MSQTRHMRIIKKLSSSNDAMKAELEAQRAHMRPATEAALVYTIQHDTELLEGMKSVTSLDSQKCAIYEKALEKKVEELSLELASAKDELAAMKTELEAAAALMKALVAEGTIVESA